MRNLRTALNNVQMLEKKKNQDCIPRENAANVTFIKMFLFQTQIFHNDNKMETPEEKNVLLCGRLLKIFYFKFFFLN